MHFRISLWGNFHLVHQYRNIWVLILRKYATSRCKQAMRVTVCGQYFLDSSMLYRLFMYVRAQSTSQCDQVLCKEFSIHDRSRHWFSPLFVYDKLVIRTAPAISGGKGIMLSYTGTILLSFVLALTGLSITAKGNVCIYPRLWPDVTVKMNSSHNAGISLISMSKFHILFTHTEAVRDLRCESTL